ncbi:MAG: N-acetylneuraminate synthase [Elusimicrobia bacterium]|nr:N-acetylneuraminate synthase [Elusimicrobiota bacterium]
MVKVFIIAEAGINHNGSLKLAKKMVDAAVYARADAVKFQTFKSEQAISKNAPKAEYQKQTTDPAESQLEMAKKLELKPEEFRVLSDYCEKKGILFLSTPFDFESIDLLNDIGLKIFKIPSGEITNLLYLQKIGRLKKRIILSTGMANINEIKSAINVLVNEGTARERITVLHCNTAYPTPFEDVNLYAMKTIRDKLKIAVGYSDHTIGIEIPIAAVALGAVVIEKHFTLDKTMPGPDQRVSLEPEELKAMVNAIRNIEVSLGNARKTPSPSELKNIAIVRRSLVASKEIKKGELFSKDNVTAKRPGTGINPMKFYKIVGKKAKNNFKEDELITI